jgi:hypothetical protein
MRGESQAFVPQQKDQNAQALLPLAGVSLPVKLPGSFGTRKPGCPVIKITLGGFSLEERPSCGGEDRAIAAMDGRRQFRAAPIARDSDLVPAVSLARGNGLRGGLDRFGIGPNPPCRSGIRLETVSDGSNGMKTLTIRSG